MEQLTEAETEQLVLSCALVDHYDKAIGFRSLDKALAFLKSEDFQDPRHAHIWATIASLKKSGVAVEAETVKVELDRRGEWEKIGWEYYYSILELAPTSTTLGYYAAIVRDRATRRRLAFAGCQLTEEASNGVRTTTAELIKRTEDLLRELPRTTGRLRIRPLEELLAEWLAAGPETQQTLKTGFEDLDFLTHGLWPGQLVTLAARPGLGKTTMALNVAQHAALTQRKRVVFFSLEMSASELMDRTLANRANVALDLVRTHKAEGYDRKRIEAVAVDLANRDLSFVDTPSQKPEELIEAAREHHAERPLDLVVVDYLQLVQMPGTDTRAQEVANVTRALKQLAKELQAPVLALSQLNRNAERDDRPPRLADLRESGAIEQDSDVVLLLHRPQPKESQFMELLIAKQRNGPVATVKLGFNGAFCRFENPAFTQ